MAAAARAGGTLERFVGRLPDTLNYDERVELDGKWVAVELYSPVTLPLRKFEAVGASAAECRRQLAARGLDPANYEYLPLTKPF
jgi:hypothetical protein